MYINIYYIICILYYMYTPLYVCELYTCDAGGCPRNSHPLTSDSCRNRRTHICVYLCVSLKD